MGFPKNYILVTATTLLLVALVVNQCESSAIGDKITRTFSNAKEKFDTKTAFGGDGNIIAELGKLTSKKIDDIVAQHLMSGPLGESIEVLKNGWEESIKLSSIALADAFDLIDNLLNKDIEDKEAALNALNNGMNEVRSSVLHSGAPIHSSLGAAKSIANIADKGGFKFAIDKLQDVGTALFGDLDVAEFFAIQGLNADDDEVTKKCLKAAHSSIMSSGVVSVTNLLNGFSSAIEYLSSSDEATITQHESSERLISEATRAAAAADSDTVTALEALNKEFDIAIAAGINAPVLNEIKEGLVQYIQHSAWSVGTCYDAMLQAKSLAKTDPEEAIRVVKDAVRKAEQILTDGVVKALESLGSAAKATGLLEVFYGAIEITEKCRVDGIKGFDHAAEVASKGILAGGDAIENALDAGHTVIEGIEAVIFGYLHDARHMVFNALNPGKVHGHSEH